MRTQKNLQSFIGKKYNRLLIILFSDPKKRSDGRNHNMVVCKCDCGETVIVKLTYVTNNVSKSCGCHIKEVQKTMNIKHNLSYLPIYKIWASIKGRCCDINNSAYKNYGGRGITMCASWISSPQAFSEWAFNNNYCKGLDIDRINNNKGYSPNNCRFVTRAENCLNKRNTQIFLYKGETKPLKKWVELLNVDYQLVNKRLWRGWDYSSLEFQ